MKTIVPANPIKVYMRSNGDDEGYLASNVAFARVLIDGAWVSHD